jgi:hypothetical protein
MDSQVAKKSHLIMTSPNINGKENNFRKKIPLKLE